MKKAFLIILLFLSLILVAGCTKKKGYTIKIVDFSDSLSDLNISSETDVLSINEYVDKKEPKHQIVSTNFGEIETDYGSTVRMKQQFFYVREFYDSNRNIFCVDDSGIIVLYHLFMCEKDLTNKIDENIAIEIANNFIEKYNYLNFEDYVITVNLRTDLELYIVNYQKYLGEIITTDSAKIAVDLYGNLCSFSSQFLGMIPKNLELDFDFEKIEEEITYRLDKIFEKKKNNYDEIKYDLSYFYLIMLDYDKYGLVYDVKIDCINSLTNDNDLSLHEGDVIRFLVN